VNKREAFRTDIQGMRAIAVLLVILFHVFPTTMPGGYVGVDVFFVISGFLICGLILRDTEKNGYFNALSFYDRRIRRLLPAASLVLIVTAIASYFLLPETRWVDTGREIIASTLYVENFYLHFQSIDYLTADKPPSPLQHFWSLSVEEQFYIFWPFLMLVTVFISRKIKLNLRLAVSVLLAIIFVVSLTTSVIITARNPSAAYFITYTRVWELVIGGLLACLLPYAKLTNSVKNIFSALGLIMIFAAGFLFTKSTPFPGYTALLPTVGVGLLLLAGSAIPVGAALGPIQKILSFKPAIFIGDISYSLYLWHWPVVIFTTALFGKEISLPIGTGVIALSIILAAASKKWIEDPVRRTTKLKTILESYLLGLTLMVFTIIAGLMLILSAKQGQPTRPKSEANFSSTYPGALAINHPVSALPSASPSFIPSLDEARRDIATVYAHGCHTARPDTDPTPCYYEPIKSDDGTLIMGRVEKPSGLADKMLVLAGDSHAAQWLPSLKEVAKRNNYALVTYTKSSCAFINEKIYVSGQDYTECKIWGEKVLKDVAAMKPDLLVTSMISNHRVIGSTGDEDNKNKLSQGLANIWQQLAEANIPVAAIRETPRFQDQVPECIAKNIENPNACQLTRNHAMRFSGAMAGATIIAENAQLIDMTNSLCRKDNCPVIVGNILVYRDQHHITATYAKTMSEALEMKLKLLLK